MGRFATKINNFCTRTEKGLSIYGAAFLFALLLMGAACISTTSRWEPHFHGTAFSELSKNPFYWSQENNLRFRILSPLLGYLFFMRGPAVYLYFILIVMTAFIAGVYIHYRKKQYSGTESLGMAALMAFSSIVYYIFYYPAYSDPTSYLLILFCMSFYRQSGVMMLLMTLLLFNHESNLFLFPWLLYIMNFENGRIKFRLKTILPFVLPVILYAGYRFYIAHHSKVAYTLSYYFNEGSILWTLNMVWKKIPIGVFEAFKLFWVFPLLAIFYFRKNKRKQELIIFSLIFFCALLQMIIAYDISRLVCLAFPIILMGAETMRNKWGKDIFSKRLWLIIALNFLVPTYLIGALDPIFLKPLALQWLMNHVF